MLQPLRMTAQGIAQGSNADADDLGTNVERCFQESQQPSAQMLGESGSQSRPQ